MPQLDISSYFSQLFWLIITFSILYFFISGYFLPRMEKIISSRDKFINFNKEEISKTQNKIEKIRQNYADIINDAKFAAQNIVADASVTIKQLKDDAMVSLSHDIKKMHEENNEKIQQFLYQIEIDIKSVCLNLAMQYHSLLFTQSLPNKVADSSGMIDIISKYTANMENIISLNK